ncbi:hypothetical protein SCHAM137S_01912 [Streptomyces chartreusis]
MGGAAPASSVPRAARESQQTACRSGAQVHGEPHHLVPGEGQLALVGHRVPAEPGDLGGEPFRVRARRGRTAEVQDHPGTSLEQAGLCVEAGGGGGEDARAGPLEGARVVVDVGEMVIEDHSHAHAALAQVRHAPPALLVHLQRAALLLDASGEIPAQRLAGRVQQPAVTGPLVPPQQEQRGPARTPQQPGMRRPSAVRDRFGETPYEDVRGLRGPLAQFRLAGGLAGARSSRTRPSPASPPRRSEGRSSAAERPADLSGSGSWPLPRQIPGPPEDSRTTNSVGSINCCLSAPGSVMSARMRTIVLPSSSTG